MNTRLEQWAASLRERQIATSIALVCLLLIAIVSVWPDIFQSARKVASVQHAITPPAPTPSTVPAAAPEAAPAKPPVAATPESTVAEPPAEPAKAENIKPVADTSPPEPAPPAAAKTPSMPSGYYIQVGAFSDRKRAAAMQQKIHQAGWPVHVMPKARGLLGVVIGPYTSRKQAEQQQQKILQQLKLKGYPIQHTS